MDLKIAAAKLRKILFQDFYDLKTLAEVLILNRNKADNNEVINWMKIRALQFVKGQAGTIYFKTDFRADWGSIHVKGAHCSHSNFPMIACLSTKTATGCLKVTRQVCHFQRASMRWAAQAPSQENC